MTHSTLTPISDGETFLDVVRRKIESPPQEVRPMRVTFELVTAKFAGPDSVLTVWEGGTAP